MSELGVRAARLARPSWRDPRLLTGVLIVLVSVALGARVMASADDTVPVYAATGMLASGHVLAGVDVAVVRVHLGSGTAAYLSALRPLPPGLVLDRPVGTGELLPVAALATADSLTRRPVTVPLPTPLPAGLRPGSAVDLWSSAKDTGDGASGYQPPVRIAAGAEVFAVFAGDGGLSSATGDSIQVLLDEGQLRDVLDALANDAKVAVVPAPGLASGVAG